MDDSLFTTHDSKGKANRRQSGQRCLASDHLDAFSDGELNVFTANNEPHRPRQSSLIFLTTVIASFAYVIFFICQSTCTVDAHSLNSTPGSSECGDVFCLHGRCFDGRCVCDRGWQGSACHRCGGRIKLDSPSGYITDGLTNYSTDLQCTWLIDSGSKDTIIRLQLVEFETECSWDHLYIFDGDSLFAPLIAAYSGLLVRNGFSYQEVPEVVSYSGTAYLYFYSDAAYNMSGFNVSYVLNGCPKNCSGHGACSQEGACICDGGWHGNACDRPVCPSGCSSNGICDKENSKCICSEGFIGSDCSQLKSDGSWQLMPGSEEFAGRALHASAVDNDVLWITGGEYFKQQLPSKSLPFMIKYDFITQSWNRVESQTEPPFRFGHTLTPYKGKLYMYGGLTANGTVSSELWIFNTYTLTWFHDRKSVNGKNHAICSLEYCGPIGVVGHTATLVDDRIIFIFGHSALYGYVNIVQEYNISSGSFSLISTNGALIKGGFGHSAAFDSGSRLIFVYGGYHSFGSDSVLVDYLYAYDPDVHMWTLMSSSSSPRYLHGAVVMNGVMLVYGGNGHNATSDNAGDKCFSPSFMMYHIECDTWYTLKDASSALRSTFETGRFGHSTVIYDGSIYVYGGFNGVMLNSLLKYTPGNCSSHSDQLSCERAKPGRICAFNSESSICQSITSPSSSKPSSSLVTGHRNIFLFSEKNPWRDRCDRYSNSTHPCNRQVTCESCLDNNYGCVWCADSCHAKQCPKQGIKSTSKISSCANDLILTSNCDKLHNCHACHTEPYCGWQTREHKCFTFVKDVGNVTQKVHVDASIRQSCDVPCYQRPTCETCSAGPSCMWCGSLQRCIESNAYAAIFPMAQCMEWTIHSNKCTNCSDIQTCDKCQQNPRCGWCDDGSGTGVGKCLEGAAKGPYVWSPDGPKYTSGVCSKSNWFFTSCPDCQCNGHSRCHPGTTECQKPCMNLTEGSHCQHCLASYYGNPVNGGQCKPCNCHGHSVLCNRETGKCHCTTKGIIGESCEKCDEQNHYFGNPTEKGGSCYYNLTIDFQYTFNMSKVDDKYLTRINFMNVPMKPDVDVDFTITCSKSAYVNISIGSRKYKYLFEYLKCNKQVDVTIVVILIFFHFPDSLPVRTLHEVLDCGSFKLRFSHDEHLFGIENTTFYVNVYRFDTPFILQISFSQHRTLDLLQFFVTFSSCFLTLLIIAAILWKIKQRYDMYRRRQQLFLELQSMASRPFSGINLDLEKEPAGSREGDVFLPWKNNNPTPVALEPCSTGKAAVLSLIVRLPTGGTGNVPAGQTGLAIASALVSLGTLDHKFVKDTPEPSGPCKHLTCTTKCVTAESSPTVL